VKKIFKEKHEVSTGNFGCAEYVVTVLQPAFQAVQHSDRLLLYVAIMSTNDGDGYL